MNRPKHCPRCRSSRVVVYGFKFYCRKCGFFNDLEFVFGDDAILVTTKE